MSPESEHSLLRNRVQRARWEWVTPYVDPAEGGSCDYTPPKRANLQGFLDWFEAPNVPKVRRARREQWFAERLRHAIAALRESIEVNPRKRGGVPVLAGTRVPVAEILAELADDATVSTIADELELDPERIRGLLEGIASYLDRPFAK